MVSIWAAGLVDRLAQPGTTAEQEGLALAKDIAQGGPIALRMAKAAINHGLGVDSNTGLQLEESYYAQVGAYFRDAVIPPCSSCAGQRTRLPLSAQCIRWCLLQLSVSPTSWKCSSLQVLTTQDRIEGLKSFAEKRKPVFNGT